MKIKLRKFNAEDAYLLKKYQFHQMDMNEIKDIIAPLTDVVSHCIKAR